MNNDTIRETVDGMITANGTGTGTGTGTGKDIADAMPRTDDLMAEAKSFLERAQEVIEDAVETTVEAVKEHPLAAAAIAAGVVAAATGAAYGVSALRSDDKDVADS